MADDATTDRGRQLPRGRPDRLAFAAGACAVAWIPAALWPNAGLPAWPSASLGIVALLLASYPGHPGLRGISAFLGVAGVIGGALQIAAKWALLGAVP